MEILTAGGEKNFDVKSSGGSVKLLEISCIICFASAFTFFIYTGSVNSRDSSPVELQD